MSEQRDTPAFQVEIVPHNAGDSEDGVLRRPSTRTNKFQPRPVAPSDVVLDRNVLRSSVGDVKPQTQRRRELVGDLPDWHPLPPGELDLRRPGSRE